MRGYEAGQARFFGGGQLARAVSAVCVPGELREATPHIRAVPTAPSEDNTVWQAVSTVSSCKAICSYLVSGSGPRMQPNGRSRISVKYAEIWPTMRIQEEQTLLNDQNSQEKKIV